MALPTNIVATPGRDAPISAADGCPTYNANPPSKIAARSKDPAACHAARQLAPDVEAPPEFARKDLAEPLRVVSDHVLGQCQVFVPTHRPIVGHTSHWDHACADSACPEDTEGPGRSVGPESRYPEQSLRTPQAPRRDRQPL